MGWLSDTYDGAVGLVQKVNDYREGYRQGEIEAVKDYGQEWKDTGTAVWHFITDSGKRDQMIDGAAQAADKAWQYGKDTLNDPAKPVRDIKNGAGAAITQAEDILTTADAKELGHAVGYTKNRIGIEIATTLIPVGKVSKLGKLGTAIDKTEDIVDASFDVARTVDKVEDAAEAAARRASEAARAANKRFPENPPSFCASCVDEVRLARTKDGEILIDGQRVSTLSTKAKGNFGETMADQWAKDMGWGEPIGRATKKIGDGIDKGIDGLFKNPTPPPGYIVVETKYANKLAPYGKSKLGEAKHPEISGEKIAQMSEYWVDDRLQKGFDPAVVDDVLIEDYKRVILQVDRDGNVYPDFMD